MQYSFTYYITLLVIKLKSIKKDFSKDPIDFKKIRKSDVKYPKNKFWRINKTHRFNISNTLITELSKPSNCLLIFIHGGAFISGPGKHHWNTIEILAKQINHTIWMCDYPKAPEYKIVEISENINQVYKLALEKYKADQITIIGDSVGGTLTIALIQRLNRNYSQIPNQIILISPVMDASMSNPEIEKIEQLDPVLSKIGVLSAKRMCAGSDDLKDIQISPLYGNYEKFPKTILFLAQNDIMFPDQKLLIKKLAEANVNFKVFEGRGMPHIWPLLPVMKEAKIALGNIIDVLKK